MWGLEHAALAYLVILPIYAARRRTIEPEVMIFIFAFSNLADAMHFGQFRLWLHNTPGLLIAFAAAIIIFRFMNIVFLNYMPVLGLAVFTHVAADLLFSNFYLLWPMETIGYSLFGWMSPEHMLAGSVLIPIFIIVFVCNGDYRRLKDYVYNHEEELFARLQRNRKSRMEMKPYYLFFLLRIFLGIQILLLAMQVMLLGLETQIESWTLMAVSLLGFAMLIGLSLKME